MGLPATTFALMEEWDKVGGAFIPNSIVKVVSTLPEKNRRLEGSGLLFRYQNRAYVLTSEHVLIHDNVHAGQSVESSQFGIRAAKLIVSDWGRGLGLLEVMDLDAKKISFEFYDKSPGFNESRMHASWKQIDFERKFIAGYPFGTSELRVVKPQIPIELVFGEPFQSKVHPLAKVLHINMSAEFGMSGGVYIYNNVHLFGVLSYLQSLLPGLSPDVFAIDRETIDEFLLRSFAGVKPECEQKLEEQLQGKIPACGERLIAQVKVPNPWKLLEIKWQTLVNSLFYSSQWANSFSGNVIVKSGFRVEVENFYSNLSRGIEVYLTDPLRAKTDVETCENFLSLIKHEASGDKGIKPYYDSLQSIKAFLQEIVPLDKFQRPPNY